MKGFTYNDYKRMLQVFINKGYVFVSFNQLLKEKVPRTVCLLHDVDVSLQAALEVARIDHGLGIKSTFHILTVSELYNPFSPKSQAAIDTLLSLGHHIGLHWVDKSPIPPVNQLRLLTHIFDILDGSTQHCPIPGTKPWGDMSYFADSRGSWRYGHPLDSQAFKDGKPIGLVVHPFLYGHKETYTPMHRVIGALNRTINELDESIKLALPGMFKDESK